MGIKSFLTAQFSTVIEWADQSPNLLFYRFPAPTAEIKNASKLLVAPGQGCLLVYEGQVTAVLTEEGVFSLATDNHPFITALLKLRQGFESEHKLRIYFFRRAELTNQTWGTATPVKYVDPVYQFPVELGVHGNYAFRLTEPARFFAEVVGARAVYTAAEARDLLQGRIAQDLAAVLAAAALSTQHIDAHLGRLSAELADRLNAEFARLGFALTDFKLEGTVFDKDTQGRIRRIADTTADALAAAQGGLSYAESERLKALREAARNKNGLAAAGAQLGAGLELSHAWAGKKAETPEAPDPAAQLQKLKRLLDEGIITPEEFDAKKREWLTKL